MKATLLQRVRLSAFVVAAMFGAAACSVSLPVAADLDEIEQTQPRLTDDGFGARAAAKPFASTARDHSESDAVDETIVSPFTLPARAAAMTPSTALQLKVFALIDHQIDWGVTGEGMKERRQGRQVLATIPIDLEELDFTMSFHPARPGLQGLTVPDLNHIEIYVDEYMSDDALRHIIAHELGHAVDIMRMTPQDRSDWLELRGIETPMSWWPAHQARDFATPAGDFAECFAAHLVESASQSDLGDCAGTGDFIDELLVAENTQYDPLSSPLADDAPEENAVSDEDVPLDDDVVTDDSVG